MREYITLILLITIFGIVGICIVSDLAIQQVQFPIINIPPVDVPIFYL